MPQIAHRVRIRSRPGEVFQRVATTEGIAAWFTEAASPGYREGGRLELHFPDGSVGFEIRELRPPRRIVWHCTSRENPWFGTDVVFDFAREGDRTVVRFDHAGWPEISDRFRDCSQSWAYFLESLRLLVETGRGTPESVAPACGA